MYFSLETSGQKEVHLKQSKGRCFFHFFFNIQHVVKRGHALCGGSINWFPKGSEKLMEDIIPVTIKDDSLGCSSSSGSPMAFRAWTTCFLYSFHQHLAHRILGQMDAGSGVLVCHTTQEQIPTCWPTGLLQELFMFTSAKPYKRSLFHNTCFFSPIGGNTLYLALRADILHYKHCHYRFRSTFQSLKRKALPGQNAPSSWGGHLSCANWIAP